ncbi:unnamed protein product [Withania somnifera]
MAYRNDRPFRSVYSPSSSISGDDFHEYIDQNLYKSDEFCMYAYKIKRCPNLRSHNWTSCPFTHHGEKARRRDPRKYNYLPIPCPSYKFASCIKGDNCELCHGVFEYWLHPAKYKTHLCHAGMSCDRRVCFFAHTLNELRLETKYNWCYMYQYPLHIQPYPDILIENEPNDTWMVISCNHHLPLLQSYENSSTCQQNNISSSQSQLKFDQNESDFSFFSTNHARLVEELKNLEIESSTSHCKVNDEKGKKPIE